MYEIPDHYIRVFNEKTNRYVLPYTPTGESIVNKKLKFLNIEIIHSLDIDLKPKAVINDEPQKHRKFFNYLELPGNEFADLYRVAVGTKRLALVNMDFEYRRHYNGSREAGIINEVINYANSKNVHYLLSVKPDLYVSTIFFRNENYDLALKLAYNLHSPRTNQYHAINGLLLDYSKNDINVFQNKNGYDMFTEKRFSSIQKYINNIEISLEYLNEKYKICFVRHIPYFAISPKYKNLILDKCFYDHDGNVWLD